MFHYMLTNVLFTYLLSLCLISPSCAGAQHSGAHHHLGAILGQGLVHESPDPEGTRVVRTHVVTGHDLYTKLVIVRFSLLAQTLVGLLDSIVINVSAAVAGLVRLLEVSISVASKVVDLLTAGQLSLDLIGGL